MNLKHICFTAFSSEERKELSEKATNMGLIVDTNFDLETEALIADRIGTDKYRLATEKKIPILKKNWLLACEQAGGLVNIEKYKLPCLFNCSISVTGFQEKQRHQIQKLCEQNGATYSSSLTTGFTHLICLKGGSDKFKFALSNNINIVSIDWIKSSVNIGYALDESDFILGTISEEEKQQCYEIANKFKQQIGLEMEELVKPSVKQSILQTQAITRSEAFNNNNSSTQSFNCTLGSQLSAEDAQLSLFHGLVFYLVGFPPDKVTIVRRSIRKYGGTATFTTHNLNYIIANENTPEETIKTLKEKLNYDPPVVSYKWFLNCIESMQILPIIEDHHHHQKHQPLNGHKALPPTSTIDVNTLEIDISEEDLSDAIHSQSVATSSTISVGAASTIHEEEKLFSGLLFKLTENLSSQKQIAKSIIERNGGKIVNLELEYDFIIYPESCKTPRENNQKIRSLKWLKDSETENVVKKVEDCILYMPTFRLALDKIKSENGKVIIVISGFPEQKDLLQSIIEALGASTSKSMRKNTNVLVCEKKSDKSDFANKHNIPIVSEKWLIDSYKAGFFLSPTDFIFHPNSTSTTNSVPSVVKHEKNIKDNSTATNSTTTTPLKSSSIVTNTATVEPPVKKEGLEQQTTTPTKTTIIMDENARDSSSPHHHHHILPSTTTTTTGAASAAIHVDTAALTNFKNKLLDKLPKKKDTTTKAIEFSEQSDVHFIPKKNLESLTFFNSQHTSESNSLSHYGGTSEAENEYNEKVKNDRNKAPSDFSMSLGTFAETQVIDHDNELQKTKWKQMYSKRHFLLSSLTEKQKKEIIKQVHQLDGVIDEMYIEDVTTHFIAGSAIQTEKFLCSVAAGIWILCPQYVEHSFKQQYWISEDGYQWLDKKDEIKSDQQDAIKYMLTGKKIQDSKTKPFTGMSVYFYRSDSTSYPRIIAAGGGRVLPSITDQCTHIFYKEEIDSATRNNYPNIKIASEDEISSLLTSDYNEKKVPRPVTSNEEAPGSEKKKRKVVRKK